MTETLNDRALTCTTRAENEKDVARGVAYKHGVLVLEEIVKRLEDLADDQNRTASQRTIHLTTVRHLAKEMAYRHAAEIVRSHL